MQERGTHAHNPDRSPWPPSALPQNTASPPTSPNRRKPVPLPHGLTPIERYDWGKNAKPLPAPALPDSPRIRQSPVSPVKVNFQPDDWPRPSTGNIETQVSHGQPMPLPVPRSERALPKTPDAPMPPPHTPLYQPEYVQHEKSLLSDPNGTENTHPNQVAGVLSAEFGGLNMGGAPGRPDVNRNSRESEATASTSRQQTSAESSATTSASSVSGILDACDNQDNSAEASTVSSIIDEGALRPEPVPQLQYHHSAFLPRPASTAIDPRAQSNPNLGESPGRNLPTPYIQISALGGVRPPTWVALRTGHRLPIHANPPDVRPSSFAELLNVPYPQPAPAPITFDNSQLRSAVGNNASLLSAEKTLEMYRQNVKKTNDFSILYSFAVFLISTAQEQGLDPQEKRTKSPKPVAGEGSTSSPHDLVREARAILQKLSNNGYPFAQYYLADGYASGLFSKGKEDYNSAFPLFVLAAKHGHAESGYRTALCYEFGWGCRKDPAKAVQFLRTAAAKRHPGAMTRLGKACLSGDLGEKRYREGVKWLKLAAEAADAIYNAAPYHLGCLYETGYGDDVFLDESYAAELFTQAADLGHPEANYRMGDAYEHGKLSCPRDPALSVHFYTGAAERGHAAAMMGLCAWYMVGAEPVLDKDEEEAYEWARRSAELGYVKAQYAVGYFTEMGIGCRRDILEANVWYVKAADAGDDRAKQRLAVIRAAVSGGTPMEVGPPRNGKARKSGGGDDSKECIVM
ncbi:Chitin synthase 4 [Collariella sp. IMI 366227]|nr:Chitin synthase 4 [Collariella sp. IMI 366227]